jgi:proliferating cell nuclear antigen PCNA
MEILLENQNKIKIFQNIIQVLSLMNDTISIKLFEDKLKVLDMDDTHICLFELILDNQWFDKYNIKTNHTIRLNLKNFVKILNCIQDGQRLSLSSDHISSDKLMINFLDANKTKKTPIMEFEINLMTRDEEPIEMHKLDHTNSDYLSIQSSVFESIVNLVGSFGDTISINYRNNSFEYSSEGNFCESKIKNAIVDITKLDDYLNNDDIHLSLSINYLSKLAKASKISTDLIIYLNQSLPACFKYIFATNCHLIYWISPKIEEDEDE